MSATAVMEGVRILEVAEHTFVPAASALLADWGAEVIKIEHVERGDAMRGLASTGVVVDPQRRARAARALEPGQAEPGPRPHHRRGARHPLQAGRHLRRLPHQQAAERAQEAQDRASRTSGPTTRSIIYVRGTGQGERGPDADKGSYDSLAFWAGRASPSARSRPSTTCIPIPPGTRLRRLDRRHDDRRRDHGRAVPPRAHRRGDHRRRVAARHRACGPWARPCALSLVLERAVGGAAGGRTAPSTRWSRNYQTKDGRSLSFTCLQAGKYWADAVRGGRPARAGRPTRASPTTPSLLEHSLEAQAAMLRRRSPNAPLAEWRERLADFTGQWAVVQDTLEARRRPADRRQRLLAGRARPRRARRSSWSPHRCSSTSEPAPARPRAGVQRAWRRHPRRARARLGHHRGPQGPRRRRVTNARHHRRPVRRTAHVTVRCIPLRRQAGPRRRRRHRHGCRRGRAGPRRRRRGRGDGLRRGHARRARRPST